MADDFAPGGSTYGAITVGSSASGNIEVVDDTDWFAVTLLSGHSYTFEVRGSPTGNGTLVDPYVSIRNSAGTKLAEDDNTGTGANARLTYAVTSGGTYYLSAGAGFSPNGTGTYRAYVTDVTPAPTDDYAPSGGAYGAITVGSSASGNIEVVDDTDWFAVTLLSGHSYTFEVRGSPTGNGTLIDPYVSIRNSAGTKLAEDDNTGTGANALLTYTVATGGTYYLSAGAGFSPNGTGTYRAYVTDVTPAPTDDYAPGGGVYGAITVGSSASGNIETVNDTDWFAVTLQAGRTYTFEVRGSGTGNGTLVDPYVSIRDTAGLKLAEDDNSGTGANGLLTYSVTATGTYYLGAGAGFAPNGTGTYRAYVTDVTPTDDFGPGAASYGAISVGGSSIGNIEVVNDTDWFAVTLQAGRTYTFEVRGSDTGDGSLVDPYVSIRDTAGIKLAGDDNTGTGANGLLTYTITATGTYYLGAGAGYSPNGTGTYRAYVTDVTAAQTDDFADELGDATTALGQLSVGSSVTGIIQTADANDTYGDKDVFAVNLVAGQSYKFSLTSQVVNGFAALPLGIFTVRDSNFTSVLATSAIAASTSQTINADVSGTYYIRVGTGGLATDQGGYKLSVANVTPPPATDDFPNYPGQTGTIYALSSVPAGSSKLGSIEVSSDKDAFSVSTIAGHRYQISVTGESSAASATALQNIYVTLRDGASFGTVIRASEGLHQTTLTFTGNGGIEYVRIGAGGDGSGTGGYRISLADLGVAPPPPSPPTVVSGPSPIDQFSSWVSNVISEIKAHDYNKLFSEETWKSLTLIAFYLKTSDLNTAVNKLGGFARALNLAFKAADVATELQQAPNFGRAVSSIALDMLVGQAVHTGVGATAAAAGFAVGGPLGLILAKLEANAFSDRLYEKYFSSRVRDFAGAKYDYYTSGIPQNTPIHNDTFLSEVFAANLVADPTDLALDADLLVRFDETFYVQSHPDVVTAIANGSVGSALLHYLTIGIDLGYQPNASQVLTRVDLPWQVIDNDPLALGNSVLYTQPLGQLAGDGVSTAEALVVAAINALRGGMGALTLDATLSAIAHRKAMDLIANGPGGAAGLAMAATDADWAKGWANGNVLSQQFIAALEQMLGKDYPLTNLQLLAAASSQADAAQVLQRFLEKSDGTALTDSHFDTAGIAEVGGLWVVLLADRISGSSAPGADTLMATTQFGSSGDDLMLAGTRTATLNGGDGNDILIGGANGDTLIGGGGLDQISGAAGNDTLLGGDDNDYLYGGSGADVLDGGAGFDFASYSDAASGLVADLATPAGNSGEAAGDTFSGIEGLIGSAFNDILRGDAGDNWLYGGNGSDVLFGREGADVLLGEAGIDYLYGDAGADNLIGAAGDDHVTGGAGADVLNGGDGFDYAHYDAAPAGLTVDIVNNADNTGEAVGDFFAGVEAVVGSAFDDSIRGDVGTNWLYGGAGSDFLYGRGGLDYLIGGAGNDYLFGGTGTDVLYGEAGADRFVFSSGEGIDYVMDFNHAQGDVLYLAAASLGVSNFAQVQARMVQSGGDTIIGFNADSIMVVVGVTPAQLVAADFVFG